MKKIIAAALALTMTLGMSTTALAAGNVDGAGVGSQDPIDVTAKYNDDATEPTIRTPTPIRIPPLPVGIRSPLRLRPPTTPTPRLRSNSIIPRRALPA